MRKFSITTNILAPAGRVWQVMSDTDRWHEWTPSVISIKRIGGGPLVTGSRAMIRQPKFPPALWKVTAIEPARSFTWVNSAPGIRVVAHHLVEPTPDGCRVTLSLDLQGVLGGVFGRLTKGITERYLVYEAAGLKARSEDPDFHYQAEAA